MKLPNSWNRSKKFCALFVLCLDGLDGWLARLWGLESEFGACYDVEVDTLFVGTLSYVLWGRGLAGWPWAR